MKHKLSHIVITASSMKKGIMAMIWIWI